MKNFGLSRLAVVPPVAWEGAPRGGGPGTAREDVLARAARLARHASDVLDGLELHPDLRAALGSATWVVGTTSRAVEGRPWLDPRATAAELWRRSAAGEVALVFGEERRGLSDGELELCQAVCTIPTAPAYDSMNLAQAVAVLSYELRLAGRSPGAPGPSQAPPRSVLEGTPEPVAMAPARAVQAGAEPAQHATVEALWDRARAVLSRTGFLNPQNPEHILADLRRLISRAEPTQREVELVLAALRTIERKLD
jgi:tRNA/rRNA methyltransferase